MKPETIETLNAMVPDPVIRSEVEFPCRLAIADRQYAFTADECMAVFVADDDQSLPEMPAELQARALAWFSPGKDRPLVVGPLLDFLVDALAPSGRPEHPIMLRGAPFNGRLLWQIFHNLSNGQYDVSALVVTTRPKIVIRAPGLIVVLMGLEPKSVEQPSIYEEPK